MNGAEPQRITIMDAARREAGQAYTTGLGAIPALYAEFSPLEQLRRARDGMRRELERLDELIDLAEATPEAARVLELLDDTTAKLR